MLAKEHGLEGIHYIQTLNGFRPVAKMDLFDSFVEFEPHYTLAQEDGISYWKWMESKDEEGKYVLDYDQVWSKIINRSADRQNIIPGAFVDWDNTARRGKEGTVYHGASPDKFEQYLTKQIRRAKQEFQSEYLFINAWNEWAEGAYLEPDKRFEDRYLRAVNTARKNAEIE